jgi:hypothetical protein
MQGPRGNSTPTSNKGSGSAFYPAGSESSSRSSALSFNWTALGCFLVAVEMLFPIVVCT